MAETPVPGVLFHSTFKEGDALLEEFLLLSLAASFAQSGSVRVVGVGIAVEVPAACIPVVAYAWLERHDGLVALFEFVPVLFLPVAVSLDIGHRSHQRPQTSQGDGEGGLSQFLAGIQRDGGRKKIALLHVFRQTVIEGSPEEAGQDDGGQHHGEIAEEFHWVPDSCSPRSDLPRSPCR